jgi:hypothetical protein
MARLDIHGETVADRRSTNLEESFEVTYRLMSDGVFLKP